jgi:phosphate starvation-inducible protein PhoH
MSGPKKPDVTDKIQKEKAAKTTIKFNIQLSEEQKDAKSKILNNDITFLTGTYGTGKAQPLDSLVLTPNGYIKMGDVKEGQLVCTPDGKTAKVLGVFPQGKKKIVKITFNDKTTVECCEDHLWNVQHKSNKHTKNRRNNYKNNNHGKFVTKSVKELLETELKSGQTHNWYIPVSLPVEFAEPWIENKIDPYILGCLLGDGCLVNNSAMITSADQQIIEAFRAFCESKENLQLTKKIWKEYDYGFSKTKKSNTFIQEKNWLVSTLLDLGLLNHKAQTKFVPTKYLLQSVEDRLALLQGLLDTDGGIESGSITFNTTSKQLAEDVVFLTYSLGGIARVSSRESKLNGERTGSITNRVNIVLPKQFAEQAFRLKRKNDKLRKNKKEPLRAISQIEYIEDKDCQCIYVDSDEHLYITDNFIVTHNTLVACQIGLDMLFKKEVKKIIVARPLVNAGEDMGFLPGGVSEKTKEYLMPIYDNMYQLYDKKLIDKEIADGRIEICPLGMIRGRTYTDSFVIIDEIQNCTFKQTEAIVSRLGFGSKMILCGDGNQIDLKSKKDSGISLLKRFVNQVPGFIAIELKQNHRHPIVDYILKVCDEVRD